MAGIPYINKEYIVKVTDKRDEVLTEFGRELSRVLGNDNTYDAATDSVNIDLTQHVLNEITYEGDNYYIEPPVFRVPYSSIKTGALDVSSYAGTVGYDQASPQTLYLDNQIPEDLAPACLGLARVYTSKLAIEPAREGDIFLLKYPINQYSKNIIDLYGVINANTKLYTYTHNIDNNFMNNLPINTKIIYLGQFKIEDTTGVDTILRCIKPFEYQTTIV